MINRLEDKEAIENIYKGYAGKSALLLVYARSGVGKSLLMDKVFANLRNCSYVRVHINQQQAEEVKGFYLSCLSKALNNYAHETGDFHTIEKYIDSIYEINKNGEKIINDLLDIAAILINRKFLREKMMEPERFKSELIKKVLESDNDIAISFLLEYILYISKGSKIVISIENIQQANHRLIEFLNVLLKKTENLFVIGEYTINDSEFEIVKLFKQFPYDRTSIYELKKLDKLELIGGISQIAEIDNPEAIRQIIEASYDESHGNLSNLQFLLKKEMSVLGLAKNGGLKSIRYDNALHLVYSGLTNNQKMLLWYIVTHIGSVRYSILKALTETTSVHYKVDENLAALAELRLLRFENDVINLTHDSMIEMLKGEDDSKKFLLIANQAWLVFYRNALLSKAISLYEKDTDRTEILTLQLTFILNIGGYSNIDWMNIILSEISESLSASSSKALVSKVLSIFYSVIETNENQRLIYQTYEWITIILSKLGQWEEIRNITLRYKPNNPSDLLCLLQSTARVATCDPRVINDLEKITNKTNPFLYIGSLLLQLRYYRTFCQIKKARQIWNQLLQESGGSPYKYIIIDQINLCSFNFRKRKLLLQKAERGHLEQGNQYQFCSTLLNINANAYYLYFSKLLSRKKYLSISYRNLNRVKDLLAETHYPLHIYLNQKSIFQFVEAETPADILIENFKSAYFNCGISGNRPLIGANIIAVGLKYNIMDGLSEYIEELMQLSRKYSKLGSEFAKYPLINCFNYFRKSRNISGQKEVLQLYRKNSSLNDISDYLMAVPIINRLTLRSIRYYPNNISNWDIDFEAIQKHF